MSLSQPISKPKSLNQSIKNEDHLAFARGEINAVVLLDQSEAFVTIAHSTLLKCLSSWFGVGGVVLNLFKLFLCDHYQCIMQDCKLCFIQCQKDIVWCAPGLSPGENPVFIIHFSP